MSREEITTNNVQATDDEEISNAAVTTTSRLTPSDVNLFQTFLRMAVAMFLVFKIYFKF